EPDAGPASSLVDDRREGDAEDVGDGEGDPHTERAEAQREGEEPLERDLDREGGDDVDGEARDGGAGPAERAHEAEVEADDGERAAEDDDPRERVVAEDAARRELEGVAQEAARE